MKLIELNLKYYGPFTNKTLRFKEDKGLHIVYGPNEAGKSTALRALHNGLFGFTGKEAERDAHVHDAGTLAIGLTVHSHTGDLLQVIRKKGGGSKSLIYADSGIPVGSAWNLPVASADDFRMLFGIDYDRLVKGGRELAEFKGELGQAMLAAAGDTGAALRAIEEAERRCGALYKRNGSAPALNAALREYRDAKAAINRERLSPADLKRMLREIDDVGKAIEQFETQIREQKQAQRQTERLLRAATHARRLAVNRSQLEELGANGRLTPGFEDKYIQVQNTLRDAEARRKQSALEAARLDSELAQLVRQPLLAGLRSKLERLSDRSAEARTAAIDLPKRMAELTGKQGQRMKLCRDLGIEDGVVPALTIAEKRRIQSLASEHVTLQSARNQMPKRIQNLLQRSNATRNELAGLPQPADVAALRHLLSEIPAAKRSGEELAKLQEQHRQALLSVERELDALPVWSGTAEDLESAVIPLSSQIRAFEKRYSEIDRVEMAEQSHWQRLTSEKAELAAKLADIERNREVPTEADLVLARQRRDGLWTQVHAAWTRSHYDGVISGEYVAAVAAADGIADEIRTEAAKVEQKRNLNQQLAQTERKLELSRAALGSLSTRRAELDAEWRASWPESVCPVGSAVDMQEWVECRRHILEKVQSARALAGSIAVAEEQDRIWRFSLSQALGVQQASGALVELVALARTRIESADALQSRRAELEGALKSTSEQLDSARGEEQDLESRWNGWVRAWSEATTKLPANQMADPALAQTVLDTLHEIGNLDVSVADLERRIRAMRDNQAAFDAGVREIAGEAGWEEQKIGDPLVAYQQLRSQSIVAAEAEQKADHLTAERSRHIHQALEAERQVTESTDLLRELACAVDPVGDIASIPGAIEASRKRTQLEREILDDETALRQACPGEDWRTLALEAASVDLEGLETQRQEVDQRIDLLNQQYKDACVKRQQLQDEYDRRSQTQAVIQAAALRESAAAQIVEYADEYVRAYVRAALLRRALELYRERRRDPLLDLVSEYFGDITCGRYTRVRVEQDDFARYLVAVRGDGTLVTVDGMSEGTRDQLFLALRLAHVATQCKDGEPCPLILDDVLMAFDDERTKAALAALHRVAKQTQVLVFTHHRHHVDLAEDVLKREEFQLHELVA